jgi:hypothetical protein
MSHSEACAITNDIILLLLRNTRRIPLGTDASISRLGTSKGPKPVL